MPGAVKTSHSQWKPTALVNELKSNLVEDTNTYSIPFSFSLALSLFTTVSGSMHGLFRLLLE